MATARTSRGHGLVVVLVALTALAHAALALVPGPHPVWVPVVSGAVALVAAVLVGLGLPSGPARFGGDREDAWLVAAAATGAAGVAAGLVAALVSFSGGGEGADLWAVVALLVDALTVRLAVFTLRRTPAGR